MSEWISVEDRLPENDTKVIVSGKRQEQYVGGLGDFTKDFIGAAEHFDDGCFVHGINVEIKATHWRPLPEPPTQQ